MISQETASDRFRIARAGTGRFWTAFVMTSILFGAVHLANVFVTGDLSAAAFQAVAAGCSGVLFLAVRLRSGSLYPGMLLHCLWDFAVTTFGIAVAQSPTAADVGPGLVGLLLAPSPSWGSASRSSSCVRVGRLVRTGARSQPRPKRGFLSLAKRSSARSAAASPSRFAPSILRSTTLCEFVGSNYPCRNLGRCCGGSPSGRKHDLALETLGAPLEIERAPRAATMPCITRVPNPRRVGGRAVGPPVSAQEIFRL